MLFSRIINAASMVEKERSRRLGTSILNQVVQEAVAFKPPPRTRGGKRGRVYFSTQVNFLHCTISYHFARVPIMEEVVLRFFSHLFSEINCNFCFTLVQWQYRWISPKMVILWQVFDLGKVGHCIVGCVL